MDDEKSGDLILHIMSLMLIWGLFLGWTPFSHTRSFTSHCVCLGVNSILLFFGVHLDTCCDYADAFMFYFSFSLTHLYSQTWIALWYHSWNQLLACPRTLLPVLLPAESNNSYFIPIIITPGQWRKWRVLCEASFRAISNFPPSISKLEAFVKNYLSCSLLEQLATQDHHLCYHGDCRFYSS